ncbi:MAG: hypothetical protein ACK4MF_03125 [Hyphomicrobiaceae bacterium]
MPQVLFLVVAGAGLYAAARWSYRQLERMAEETRRAAEAEMERQAEMARSEGARDLGKLVFDPATGQYRPKT